MLAQIGSGGYGQVVKARQKSNNKIVAIKLQKNAFTLELLSKRFVSEVSIMRRLSEISKNIYTVRLLDILADEELDNVFLVMDYENKDLN